MALFKEDRFVSRNASDIFDADHKAGRPAPLSGIYRCLGCGREVTSDEGNALPSLNHHPHAAGQGMIRWRLIVYADHREK